MAVSVWSTSMYFLSLQDFGPTDGSLVTNFISSSSVCVCVLIFCLYDYICCETLSSMYGMMVAMLK